MSEDPKAKYNKLNDTPTEECLLGRQNWIKAIAEKIQNSHPPKVLAVHGTWGTGKTSALLQVYRELGGIHSPHGTLDEERTKKQSLIAKNNGTICVWFEAWHYQQESNILSALLNEIRSQLSNWHQFIEGVKETAFVAVYTLMESIELTFNRFGSLFGASEGKVSGGLASKIIEATELYQKERFSTPLDSIMLKKQLQEAIDKLLNISFFARLKDKKDYKKLVIFIDDLDRCEPAIAYQILEAIKVYLDLNNCVFVLGMDVRAVDKIISLKYKDTSFGGKAYARLYLEKICQDIYSVPRPKPQYRTELFEGLIKGNLAWEESQLNLLVAVTKKFNILPPAPRAIKILANTLITFGNTDTIKTFISESPEEKPELNIQQFLIFQYLQSFHLEVFELCCDYKDFYNSEFLGYCQNPGDYEGASGGANLHPKLKEITIYNDTPSDPMSGSTAEPLMTRKYPYENLRRVLWMTQLVLDTSTILDKNLNVLRFNG